MVQRHPGGAARRIEQGVEQRPVAHGVRSVLHGFGLAVRGCHRSAVQMVATNHDGGAQFTAFNHLVKGQTGAVALTQADPANARWQALKGNALGRHVQPAVQLRVLGKQLLHLGVGLADIFRVAAQRHPTKRPLATAKQRAHIGGHKAGEVKGVYHALVECHLADVVAVIHRGHAHGLKVQHGLHMHGAALRSGKAQGRVLRVVGLRGAPLRHAPAAGQIAVDQVMGRGLVGHDVGADTACVHPLDQLGQYVGGIAQEGNRHGFFLGAVFGKAGQRVVQIVGLLVHIAGLEAKVDAALLALDGQRGGTGKGGGQWLCAAHAAQTGGENPAPGQAALVVLPAGLDKGLVGALHNALAADVNPAAGRHLAIHHQTLFIQFVEVLPGGPLGHQVRVGNQHARCIGMGAKHAHRLAALHQQGFLFAQIFQRLQDGFIAVPIARRLANAAIDHQRIGVLGHLRVQVVLQHAVGSLDQPVLAGDSRAARGAHRVGLGGYRCGRGGHGGSGEGWSESGRSVLV